MAERGNVTGYEPTLRHFTFALSFPADGAETTHAEDLPTSGIVTRVALEVTTAEATGATKTMDIGLLSSESGGDADGFFDAVVTSATGLILQDLTAATPTRGALMRNDEDGAGAFVPSDHALNGTAKSISYTAGSADWAEFAAVLHVWVLDITEARD